MDLQSLVFLFQLVVFQAMVLTVVRFGKADRMVREVVIMCCEYDSKHMDEIIKQTDISAFFGILPKIPLYHELVFSFKPIKLESYLSQNDINKLKS